MRTRLPVAVLLSLTVVATIGCDRVTKDVATRELAGRPGRSYLADTVRLDFVRNAGGFLSLGANFSPAVRTALFTVGTGLSLAILIVVAVRSAWQGWPLFGLTLFVAGGASNWIDRLLHGSVVDFMNVGIGPLRTGIFNVADVAILLGAGLFVLTGFRQGRDVAPSSGEGGMS
jgi:signal peptidase II